MKIINLVLLLSLSYYSSGQIIIDSFEDWEIRGGKAFPKSLSKKGFQKAFDDQQ